ncbi:MAG: hypothetical protein EBT07_16995 [Actinobacteria bacterium]|nr:hypothetical protein [Actinomycetota bacterium]
MRFVFLVCIFFVTTFQNLLAATYGDFTYEQIILGGGGSAPSESYIQITKYNGSATSVSFPSSINGLPVKVLGSGLALFNVGNSVTSITIPSSVTSIGMNAFSNLTRMASVSIPSTVTHIGDGAFLGCNLLSSISLPSSLVTYYSSLGLNGGTVLTGLTLAQASADAQTSRSTGSSDVINSPNTYGLYTPSQIQDMSMGGLVLSKSGNNFTLNYCIEKSNDLGVWTQYQSFTLPLSGLSPDKAFVRLKMANSDAGSSSQAAAIVALQAQVLDLQNQISLKDTALTLAQNNLQSAISDKNSLQTQVASLQNQVTSLNAQIASLNAQIASMQTGAADAAAKQIEITNLKASIVSQINSILGLTDLSSVQDALMRLKISLEPTPTVR